MTLVIGIIIGIVIALIGGTAYLVYHFRDFMG